ncbi:unnamed protein product [Amoebophrya sp. A25]|nr:unnamed protein product [Amoebophrya sp. A25]|eukprot:GSA25T00018134001.1
MAPAFPDVKIMFYANLWSTIASCHLALCHYMATMIVGPIFDTIYFPDSVNWQWVIMTAEWFACFSYLLVWSHRWGDFLGILGNWLKMLGTCCFFVQCGVFFYGPVEKPIMSPGPYVSDDGLSSLFGISLFAVGGIVHTVGFYKLFGWRNTTTLGIVLLTIGAILLIFFFHLCVTFGPTRHWYGEIFHPDIVRTGIACGDGCLIAGSVVLLTPMVEILFTTKQGEGEGKVRASLSMPDSVLYSQEFFNNYGSLADDERSILSEKETALVIVDYQADFMDGGALAVPGADYTTYRGAMDKFINYCRKHMDCEVCWSMDSHPPGHSSFITSYDADTIAAKGLKVFEIGKLTRKNEATGQEEEYDQTMWPEHCVTDSDGWQCVLAPEPGEYIQRKGERKEFDSYSAFMDDGGKRTGLGDYLRSKGIKNVVGIGLATDFCVLFTCKDAVGEGFNTYAIPSLCRGIAPNFDWAAYTDAGVKLINDPASANEGP